MFNSEDVITAVKSVITADTGLVQGLIDLISLNLHVGERLFSSL